MRKFKVLSIILSVVMIVSMIPTTAFADNDDDNMGVGPSNVRFENLIEGEYVTAGSIIDLGQAVAYDENDNPLEVSYDVLSSNAEEIIELDTELGIMTASAIVDTMYQIDYHAYKSDEPETILLTESRNLVVVAPEETEEEVAEETTDSAIEDETTDGAIADEDADSVIEETTESAVEETTDSSITEEEESTIDGGDIEPLPIIEFTTEMFMDMLGEQEEEPLIMPMEETNLDFIIADGDPTGRQPVYTLSFEKYIVEGATDNTITVRFPIGIHLNATPNITEQIQSVNVTGDQSTGEVLTVVYKDAVFASGTASIGFGMAVKQESFLTDKMKHNYNIEFEYTNAASESVTATYTKVIPYGISATWEFSGSKVASSPYGVAYTQDSFMSNMSEGAGILFDFKTDMSVFPDEDVTDINVMFENDGKLEWTGDPADFNSVTNVGTLHVKKSDVTMTNADGVANSQAVIPLPIRMIEPRYSKITIKLVNNEMTINIGPKNYSWDRMSVTSELMTLCETNYRSSFNCAFIDLRAVVPCSGSFTQTFLMLNTSGLPIDMSTTRFEDSDCVYKGTAVLPDDVTFTNSNPTHFTYDPDTRIVTLRLFKSDFTETDTMTGTANALAVTDIPFAMDENTYPNTSMKFANGMNNSYSICFGDSGAVKLVAQRGLVSAYKTWFQTNDTCVPYTRISGFSEDAGLIDSDFSWSCLSKTFGIGSMVEGLVDNAAYTIALDKDLLGDYVTFNVQLDAQSCTSGILGDVADADKRMVWTGAIGVPTPDPDKTVMGYDPATHSATVIVPKSQFNVGTKYVSLPAYNLPIYIPVENLNKDTHGTKYSVDILKAEFVYDGNTVTVNNDGCIADLAADIKSIGRPELKLYYSYADRNTEYGGVRNVPSNSTDVLLDSLVAEFDDILGNPASITNVYGILNASDDSLPYEMQIKRIEIDDKLLVACPSYEFYYTTNLNTERMFVFDSDNKIFTPSLESGERITGYRFISTQDLVMAGRNTASLKFYGDTMSSTEDGTVFPKTYNVRTENPSNLSRTYADIYQMPTANMFLNIGTENPYNSYGAQGWHRYFGATLTSEFGTIKYYRTPSSLKEITQDVYCDDLLEYNIDTPIYDATHKIYNCSFNYVFYSASYVNLNSNYGAPDNSYWMNVSDVDKIEINPEILDYVSGLQVTYTTYPNDTPVTVNINSASDCVINLPAGEESFFDATVSFESVTANIPVGAFVYSWRFSGTPRSDVVKLSTYAVDPRYMRSFIDRNTTNVGPNRWYTLNAPTTVAATEYGTITYPYSFLYISNDLDSLGALYNIRASRTEPSLEISRLLGGWDNRIDPYKQIWLDDNSVDDVERFKIDQVHTASNAPADVTVNVNVPTNAAIGTYANKFVTSNIGTNFLYDAIEITYTTNKNGTQTVTVPYANVDAYTDAGFTPAWRADGPPMGYGATPNARRNGTCEISHPYDIELGEGEYFTDLQVTYKGLVCNHDYLNESTEGVRNLSYLYVGLVHTRTNPDDGSAIDQSVNEPKMIGATVTTSNYEMSVYSLYAITRTKTNIDVKAYISEAFHLTDGGTEFYANSDVNVSGKLKFEVIDPERFDLSEDQLTVKNPSIYLAITDDMSYVDGSMQVKLGDGTILNPIVTEKYYGGGDFTTVYPAKCLILQFYGDKGSEHACYTGAVNDMEISYKLHVDKYATQADSVDIQTVAMIDATATAENMMDGDSRVSGIRLCNDASQTLPAKYAAVVRYDSSTAVYLSQLIAPNVYDVHPYNPTWNGYEFAHIQSKILQHSGIANAQYCKNSWELAYNSIKTELVQGEAGNYKLVISNPYAISAAEYYAYIVIPTAGSITQDSQLIPNTYSSEYPMVVTSSVRTGVSDVSGASTTEVSYSSLQNPTMTGGADAYSDWTCTDPAQARVIKIAITNLSGSYKGTFEVPIKSKDVQFNGQDMLSSYINVKYVHNMEGGVSATGFADPVRYDVKPVVVKGVVWKDTNEDGFRDSSEPIGGGYTVEVRRSSDDFLVDSTSSSAVDGSYSLNLESISEEHYVTVVLPTGTSFTKNVTGYPLNIISSINQATGKCVVTVANMDEINAGLITVPVATVTFKVVNGTLADSTTSSSIEVNLINGHGTLNSSDVPTGMIPYSHFGNGSWDVTPDTTVDGITGDVTYTYTFDQNALPETGGAGKLIFFGFGLLLILPTCLYARRRKEY